ncbi:hypothetical protein [Pseudomonas mediterranea]
MFGFVMTQEALMVAVEQGAGGDHFGVEEGVFGEDAQEVAAVGVCPIHHGGNGKTARQRSWGYGHWEIWICETEVAVYQG